MLVALPRHHTYLRWWQRYGYCQSLTIVIILGLILVVTRRARAVSNVSFAIALNLTGLGMILANCILNEYQVRYTLPMWELLAISAIVLLGGSTPAAARLLRFQRRYARVKTLTGRGGVSHGAVPGCPGRARSPGERETLTPIPAGGSGVRGLLSWRCWAG